MGETGVNEQGVRVEDGRPGIRFGLYIMMFGFGITITMISPLLPRMIGDLALTLSQGGALTTLMNAGGLFGVVLTGLFVKNWKKERMFYASYAALMLTMFIIGGARGYGLLLALFLLMGVSNRVVDVLANPLITENYRTRTGRYLNMLHMSVSLGGLTGPVALRALMDLNLSWQNTFRILSGFSLILLAAGMALIRDVSVAERRIETERDGGRQVGGQRVGVQHVGAQRLFSHVMPEWFGLPVVVAGLLMLFYSGHQIILNTWSAMFMEEVFGVVPFVASLSTTLFWVGITISRLICSRISNASNAKALIRYGALPGCVILAVSTAFGSPALTIVGFALTGLLTGATIPMLINLATRPHPENSAQITSVLFLFSIIATTAFPWLCGRLAEMFGFRAGFSLSAAALLAVAALTFALPAAAKSD